MSHDWARLVYLVVLVLALVRDRLASELELAPASPEVSALLFVQVLAGEQEEAVFEKAGVDGGELVLVEVP